MVFYDYLDLVLYAGIRINKYILIFLMDTLKIEEQCRKIKGVYIQKFLFLGIQCSFRAENGVK